MKAFSAPGTGPAMRKTYTTDLHEIIDVILYVTDNACTLRDLPGDFAPNWRTVPHTSCR